MKKGIEVWSSYDRAGNWILCIKKQRGRFTLDEITDIAREHEWDVYLLPIDCTGEEEPQYNEESPGDYIELYRAETIVKEGSGII